MTGYMKKILWINLSAQTFETKELPEKYYRDYLGGYGLATRLIYENTEENYNPLAPKAPIAFFPGLFTGTMAPLTGRFMVAGKSPLTKTWGDSNCGGYFGPEIKKCGYDGIIITGKAEDPKYITIMNGGIDILDASELWGLDTVETESKLVDMYNGSQIASIGPAGEKLSLISGIVTDKGRIAARSGFGALMGSKNLKAIVLKGNQKIPVSDKQKLIELTKEYNKGINSAKGGAIQMWKTMGTSWMNDIVAKTGDAPIKNWKGGYPDDFTDDELKNINGMAVNKYKQKEYGCFACPVRCGGIVKMDERNIEEAHQPEYETCASFGHLILNDDLGAIYEINDLCNRAGIDTISVGGTVAYAIECFEEGILSTEETDGLELTWGNSPDIVELVKKIIHREGIGDVLADGSRKATEKLGKGENRAIHSMGQELGMHSPRYYKSLGMSYAFDPTPGRHTAASLDMLAGGPLMKPNGLFEGFKLPKRFKRSGEDRDEANMLVTALWQSTSSLGLCQFIYFFQKYPLLEILNAITGWEMEMADIITIGKRIQTLRQAFTLREGIKLIENTIPERTVDVNYKEAYKGYCKKMNWNPEDGFPTKESLKNLNLEFLTNDLY